jgi:hypothetical protein
MNKLVASFKKTIHKPFGFLKWGSNMLQNHKYFYSNQTNAYAWYGTRQHLYKCNDPRNEKIYRKFHI